MEEDDKAKWMAREQQRVIQQAILDNMSEKHKKAADVIGLTDVIKGNGGIGVTTGIVGYQIGTSASPSSTTSIPAPSITPFTRYSWPAYPSWITNDMKTLKDEANEGLAEAVEEQSDPTVYEDNDDFGAF